MELRKIRTLERVFKGAGNHYRISALLLISEHPGLTLEEIAGRLKANYHTMGEHLRRLKIAGLITKKYEGKFVAHHLSPYGEKMIEIFNTFLSD